MSQINTYVKSDKTGLCNWFRDSSLRFLPGRCAWRNCGTAGISRCSWTSNKMRIGHRGKKQFTECAGGKLLVYWAWAEDLEDWRRPAPREGRVSMLPSRT